MWDVGELKVTKAIPVFEVSSNKVCRKIIKLKNYRQSPDYFSVLDIFDLEGKTDNFTYYFCYLVSFTYITKKS